MKKSCTKCSKEFIITTAEREFLQKKSLDPPDACYTCRQARRLSLRQPRQMHRRQCDKCQKDIISTYTADSKYTIYCQECYWAYNS